MSETSFELAVGDTIDESGINHLKLFFDKLYCLYHTSSKNRRSAAKTWQGWILGTRGVASSFHTVKVVWHLYKTISPRLVMTNQEAVLRGVHLKVWPQDCPVNFVLNLGVMYDSLEELASLSKDLQERNIMLPRAHILVERQVCQSEYSFQWQTTLGYSKSCC